MILEFYDKVAVFIFEKECKMPKMKTNRGAAKRFKVKKNLIKRGSAFKSHILTKKSPKRKANLNAPKFVDSTNEMQVKKLLCLA